MSKTQCVSSIRRSSPEKIIRRPENSIAYWAGKQGHCKSQTRQAPKTARCTIINRQAETVELACIILETNAPGRRFG